MVGWKNVGEMDSYYYQRENIKKEIVDAKQKQDIQKFDITMKTFPAEEISEKQRMAFLVWKTLEMKFRLRKIQESLQEHHGTIKYSSIHLMLKTRKLVCLMGFGWNYTENFQTDARFTRLKILIATFEDTPNISYIIKFKTYLFENKASDIIIVRENGERYVLDKDFNQIHETDHKRNVQKKIAERKTVTSSVGFE